VRTPGGFFAQCRKYSFLTTGNGEDPFFAEMILNTRVGVYFLSHIPKNFRIIFIGLFNRVSLVTMCRKFRHDIFHPSPIIGMHQSVNMGKHVMVMPVGFLCTGSMGVLHLLVLRFKRMRQMSNLLLPYRFKYRIMGLEFIDSDNLAPALTGLAIPYQHPVAKKFLADGGAVRVDYAQKSRAITLPVHKNAPTLGGILTAVLHFFKFIGKFIGILRQHVNMEEFIGDSIPAKIIVVGNLALNFYEIPKTHAASPTPAALKLRHSKINFMPTRIIKLGYDLAYIEKGKHKTMTYLCTPSF
jgi:hypothetical protein